jgi:two-component sensor histidine kinase
VSFETKIENIAVNMNVAIPLGLIINELISNALKHAFPDNRKGKLLINFHKTNEGVHELIVEDDGIGSSRDLNIDNPETLGLQLMSALTSQLQGKITINSHNGTKVILTFKTK